MNFGIFHFDGAVRVPELPGLADCDMRETYTFHRRAQLLQWHCPPTLWHLKAPVHMFALRLDRGVPEREIPLEPSRSRQGHGFGVQPDPVRGELEQRPGRSRGAGCRATRAAGRKLFVGRWTSATASRFADVAFVDLQHYPVGTLRAGSASLGLTFSEDSEWPWSSGPASHKPGSRGAHDYSLSDYGLSPEGVANGSATTCAPTRPDDRPTYAATKQARSRPKCAAPSSPPPQKLCAQGVRGLSVAAVLDRAELST